MIAIDPAPRRARGPAPSAVPAFDVPGPQVTVLSSGDAWPGIRLDQLRAPSGEVTTPAAPTRHRVGVHTGAPVVIEVAWPEGFAVRRVMPGTVHLLPAGMSARSRLHGEAEWVDVSLCRGMVSNGAAAPVELWPALGVEDPLAAQLVLGIRGAADAGPRARVYAGRLAAALAAHLALRYAAPEDRPPLARGGLRPATLRAVLQYVEERLDRGLALRELAGVVGMNLFSFVRGFKQSVGVPPHRYVLGRRIERAKALLARPDVAIADVALRCGFASQSNFTSAFRRLVGRTPGAYRAALSTAPL